MVMLKLPLRFLIGANFRIVNSAIDSCVETPSCRKGFVRVCFLSLSCPRVALIS